MPYRPDRLAHELRNELSVIVAREVKDPRVGFATITNVRVSPDLRYARIYVSVLGSPEEQKETLAALHRAVGFIRRKLGGRLKLRHVPELQFAFDDSLEYGARMDGLLTEVRQELPASPPVTDENDPQSSEEGSVI
ncbi:MAG TPA: 30S ribosome-binding factor RbfA [Blastocatellia bacterium]|nr:30S ribosome-binding factor RbfA [Blastocatellia bacterium]